MVVLEAATKQYNSKAWQDAGRARGEIHAKAGDVIPFNETPAATLGNGPDHWYHLDLHSADAVAQYLPHHKLKTKNASVLGSVFTTRCPRAIDFQAFDETGVRQWIEGDVSCPISDSWLTEMRAKASDESGQPAFPFGVTDATLLAKRMRDHRITLVVILVEDDELEHVHSNTLGAFYKGCGTAKHPIRVLRTPFLDFSCPSHCLEHKDVVEICTTLAEGMNCLVHCFGGSGRTGTVVVGALCCLGLFDPNGAIKYAHSVKSTYIETPAQLDLVQGEFEEILVGGEGLSQVVGEITALEVAGQKEVASAMANMILMEVMTDDENQERAQHCCLVM
ncbi:Aste57867_2958 [Aphanomyces stellatus]|uniref:protein-tyrosine-phosphatase n=1 Tax=Aphanomyces stellatus TaxID=120398 RepID=A0A485KAD0_9STRA|nr:hypothetical protein As57867_002949 [Aphanomyces stellatus]VFT80141.1 Aste57867_2958 [Aphanomyces stellatus]